MTYRISYLIIIVLLFAGGLSCRKNIAAGKTTTVTGIAYDQVHQLPIPNARIDIVEYEGGFGGPKPVGIIDSTHTGIDGKYAITFTTTGNGIQYMAAFHAPPGYYTGEGQSGLMIGEPNVADFRAINCIH